MTPARDQKEALFRAQIDKLIANAREGLTTPKRGRPRTTGRRAADAKGVFLRFSSAEHAALVRAASAAKEKVSVFAMKAVIARAASAGFPVQ